MHRCICGSTASVSHVRVIDRGREGGSQSSLIVGRDEPTGLPVLDNLARAVRSDGDGGQTAGHAFYQDLPERLLARGQHDRVGGGIER